MLQNRLFNIIPSIKLPPDKNQVFSYLSKEKLSLGQVVEIPFRGKKIKGIIYSLNNKSIQELDFKPKEIIKQVENICLTTKQIELAKWISEYYHTSIASVIKLMLPQLVNQRTKDKNTKLATIPYPKLTEQQQKIYEKINSTKNFRVFLIHGVTGSGKTEIYLKLIEQQIKLDKQSIVLVPEISLTPQTINRFSEHFNQDQIAILHSKLSAGEKFTQWKKIKSNQAKIIIGPRSAIFAPIQNLGIIIIDEEHDSSYKQYDQNPRYHARHAAIKLASLYNANVVLGSATPSIESYHNAFQNIYSLLKLPARFTANSVMPKVKVVDMREEFKRKNFSIFSESLQKELETIIKNNRQALLYINRRGVATFVNCRDCGYVATCKNCDVPLTFHLYKQNLSCHYCGYTLPTPISCPKCKSPAIKYFGTGTEKVEQELQKMYKYVKIFRMDSDTTRIKHSHTQIYNDFRLKKANILIGTQMITKGWDLEGVDLVGVISSDVGLNLPDYKAQEKTFQLLTQIAGRTGRGINPGKVIFQTYNPESFVIKTAAKHDFVSFYKKEIKNRKELDYPPFVKLIKLIYKNADPDLAQHEAQKLFQKLTAYDSQDITLLGPAPSFFQKIQGRYIWQIIIKFKNQKFKDNILKQVSNDWIIDVDPESLL
ncbi:MAG: primosomal protein N' [Patescibacteria group bacterium]|nr:primosomal protein N' [Patescibacteria group bacterium]